MIRAATREEVAYVCEKIEYAPSRDAKGVVIVDEVGGVGACAIYDHWTHSAVQMHAYSQGPKFMFNPEFTKAIFEYPFVQSTKMLAFAVTPCDNVVSVALARFLGFREVYRIRDGWKLGTDMVLQEMRREDCRFLEK